MFAKAQNKKDRKKIRIRKKISGTAQTPRLTVFRSLNQVYCQLIDDHESATLVAASSLSKEIKDELQNAKNKTDKSKVVGKLLAQKAVEKGITSIVFDRSGYRYHGRVKALAEGAREGGLKF